VARLPKPRRRPYGHGSVSIQAKAYVATFKDLRTGEPARRSFASDDEAQVFLDDWHAKKTAAKLAGAKRAKGPNPRLPQRHTLDPGTFATLIEQWKAARQGTVRMGTWRNYDGALNGLSHYLGANSTNVLTEADFLAYRKARLDGLDWTEEARNSPSKGRVKPLKPITVNQHIDRANAIFRWAKKRGLVEQNPVENLVERGEKLKVEEFEPVVIDGETIELLISCAPEKYRVDFLLIGHLALRWSEALGVGVGHVQGDTVLIRQQIVENRAVKPYRLELASPKSKNGKRDLMASDAIIAAAAEAYGHLQGPNPHKLLRPSRTGAPYREGNWLRNAWRPAVKRAGLEHIQTPDGKGLTPHSLRHSRLSIMASSGKVNVVDLCAFAGHDSPAFTLAKYGGHFRESGIPPAVYLAGLGQAAA
jgi:integrase